MEAFIFDDPAALERKMRLYQPPDPGEVFETWSMVSNDRFYGNREEAEESRRSRGDEADLALSWKLKEDEDGPYLEYARNSVYAGFVTPEGEESDRFTLEATVTSKDDDDDSVGLIVAFLRDGEHYSVDEAGVWVDCVRERRPVIHNDYAALAHKKGMPEGHAPGPMAPLPGTTVSNPGAAGG